MTESPNSLEAERATLGAMLLAPTAVDVVYRILRDPPDNDGAGPFAQPHHNLIYRTILRMHAAGRPIDPVTITGELSVRGDIVRVGGAPYLHTLMQSVPTAANAGHYAEQVRDRAVLRNLGVAGARVVHMSQAAEHRMGDDGVDGIVDAAMREMERVSTAAGADDNYVRIGDLVQPTLDTSDALQQTLADGEQSPKGILTGFRELDELSGGFTPGQSIVVAGRPGAGKSTLGLDFARQASIRDGRTSVIFSLEMSAWEIAQRVLSAEAKVRLHAIRNGSLTEDEWERIIAVIPDLLDAPLFIVDDPMTTPASIHATCRHIRHRHGLGLVEIDYAQLMVLGRQRGGVTQEEAIGEISRHNKLLAKQLDVPVVLISQLNRGPEQRADRKPMVSDLRGSGSLEQDADMVLLVHREDMYDAYGPRAGEADLIIGKYRNGPTATVTVAFQGHYSRFIDMAAS